MTIEHNDLGNIEIERSTIEKIQQLFGGQAALPTGLFLVTAILGSAWYLIVEPMQADVAKERVALDRVVRQIRTTLAETNAELARMEDNPEVYGRLVARGLTRQQDRMAAANIMDSLRSEMGLAQIQYEIEPEREVDDRVPDRCDAAGR